MAYAIHQSTTQSPLLFFMTLSSDHLSPATGKSPTVTISKAGGAFASPSGSVTEIANGWYKVAGNSTDTNTLGPLALHATEASSDNCDLVVAEIVAYDPQDNFIGMAVSTLTESYAAVNAAPTLAQLLFEVLQRSCPTKRSVAGTTETVKKIDGSTNAMTFTLDSASNPTTVTRAT
jgi:hypothetical protein